MRSSANYRRRIVDDFLDTWSPHLPAISLEGPKGVGKTATASERANTIYMMDDPARAALVEATPSLLTNGEPPVLVDEWQRFPQSWDLVRRAVDADPHSSRFFLTGSASALPNSTHSGAGRIQRVRMWPLTMQERGISAPTVSLAELLQGARRDISGQTMLGLSDYVQAITTSGLPAFAGLSTEVAELRVADYVDRIVDTDVAEEGGLAARPHILSQWLRAYAAAIATTTSYDNLRDAATPGEESPLSKATDLAYREALERMWIVEPVPAWAPSGNYLKRLTKAPKHALADPAFAVAALGLRAQTLLDGAEPERGKLNPRHETYVGALFESLVTQHMRVFAQNLRAKVFHARTQGGREEVDLIIEKRDGRFLAVEVKLSANPAERAYKHLHTLQNTAGDALLDAVMITTGTTAYRRADGVAVVPFGLLGA